jgi:hypothetical protein
MTISGPGLDGTDPFAIRVQKLAQDQQKREGEQAVTLIDQATPPPVGPHGEGAHINTYA